MDLNVLKQEPELMQHVQSEPALLVKEEILEDSTQVGNEQKCVQGTSTPAGTGSLNEACNTSLRHLLNVKHELTDMDIEPTVIQPMDIHYTINKNTSAVTEENVMVDFYKKPMPYNQGIKKESFGDNLSDSSSKKVNGSEKRKPQRYRCDKCLKLYKSKQYLHLHNTRIHGTESHKCSQCNKEFKCKLNLVRHIRYTHSEEQYECDICKKMFKSREALNRHVSQVHCDGFADSSSKQVHDSEGHKHQAYRCNKSPKVFKSEYYRNDHIRLIHGTESNKCTQCNKEFKCKEYLSKHVQNTHSKVQYECDICKKMCKSRGALHSHSKYHRIRSAGSISSKQVHVRTQTSGLQTQTSGEKHKHQGYRCNKCLKVFKFKDYRNRHIGKAHGTKSHKCTHCNKEFKCRSYLLKHIEYAHSKEQYECDICKKMCKSRGALHAHVSKVHRNRSADDNEQQCVQGVSTPAGSDTVNEVCDTSLGDLLNVKHGLTDTEIGPTVIQPVDKHSTINKNTSAVAEEDTHVDFCNKPMPYKQGIKKKRVKDKLRDPKDSNYRCDKCMKEFQDKSNLKRHYKNVHGTECYKCTECKREFKCMSYLRTHIDRIHRNKQYECDICKKILKSKCKMRLHILGYHSSWVSGSSTGSEERKHQRYRCEKCLKFYVSEHNLCLHNTRVHGTESHKCTQCNKEFKCNLNLLRHIRYTHSEEQHECHICKKMFKSREALHRHVSQVHCDRFADSSSKQVRGSEEHKHQGYRSNQSMKVFKSEYYRNEHIKQVHGTKSHKCTQCKKEFKCKEYLSNHVQNTHSKVQYECDICKKMCKSRGALYSHSKCHRNRSVALDKKRDVGTATPSTVSNMDVAASSADRFSGLTIKQESGDTDLDIGPTVLQHMDSHYTFNQVKVKHMKMESSPLTDEQAVKNELDLFMKEDNTGV